MSILDPAWGGVYILGFFFSLPIGPVQVEVWREALTGHRAKAFRISAGASLGDVFWALAAYLSFFSKAFPRPVQGMVLLAAAGLIVYLGYRGLHPAAKDGSRFSGRHWAFLQGAACVLLNPTGVVSWTIGLGLLKKAGFPLPAGWPTIAVLALVVYLGAISYPLFVIAMAGKIRLRLRPERMERVSRGLAYLLFGLGAAFLVQATRSFL